MIHHRDSSGFESWREYDTNNNMIHHRDSNGFETWCDSDFYDIDNPNEEG
jgi:hypothetical protein